MFRQAIQINWRQYRMRMLLIILAGMILNALCFHIGIQNKIQRIQNTVTTVRESPRGYHSNSYQETRRDGNDDEPVQINTETISKFKSLSPADFSKEHDRISFGRIFYGTSIASFTGSTSDTVNFYQTSTLLQGVPIFILGILAVILAILLTSAEKMSRFAVFLSTIPVSRRRLFAAKGLLGSIAVAMANIVAWAVGFLMLYASKLGPYINYGAHHTYHLSVWIQSTVLFLIALFVGSLCGNIISHLLTMIPVLLGVLFFYMYCIIMPLMIFFDLTPMHNAGVFKFIYFPGFTPLTLMIRLLSAGGLIFLVLFAILLFAAGIFITGRECSWRFGYFFTHPVPDRIVYYLAVYSFSLIPLLIFGFVAGKIAVVGIFAVSLLINYFLFRFLFKLRFGA
ncbi:MAG: hypothetical protein Q4P30_01220 [Eubacteriales bacterium]|nr:hypothetical protein [Eubacteriales bacterium]